MALIFCPECGKKVSDKADSCPNCGWRVELLKNNYNNGSNQYPNDKKHHHDNEPQGGKKINTTAILIAVILALALITCAAILREGASSSSDKETKEVLQPKPKPEPETSKGWEYEQDLNGKTIASIMADSVPVTMKLISNGSQINDTATAVATKMYGLKDNNSIGVSINGVTYMCEAKRDEEAGSPTYLITLKSGIIDQFKTFTNFSLIFDDEKVTFSSSKALDMPSPEPTTENTPAPSTQPSAQPKPQAKPKPKPQQNSAREHSGQPSQVITDQPIPPQRVDTKEEQTVDKAIDDPKPVEEPKIKDTPRPVNQLPPNVKEKLIQQRGNDDEE